MLKLNRHGQYFEAIINNNADYVEALLSSLKPRRRDWLMNTAFDLKDASSLNLSRVISDKDTAISLPLHLAVTTHSLDVARVLIKHGADVYQANDDGCNVLHAVVMAVFYEPSSMESSVEVVKRFLDDLPPKTATELLLQENKLRFRPVEYASQQQALPIMAAYIYAIEDEFKFNKTTHGLTEHMD